MRDDDTKPTRRPQDCMSLPLPCSICVDFPKDPEKRDGILCHTAGKIISALRPSSVIDFSPPCFPLASALRSQGTEAYGIRNSGSPFLSGQHSDPDARDTLFDTDSGPMSGQRRFDLVTCFGISQEPTIETLAKILPKMVNHSHTILVNTCPIGSEISSCPTRTPLECMMSVFENHGYALDVPFSDSFAVPKSRLFRSRRYLHSHLSRPLRLFILTTFAFHAQSELRLIGPLRYLQRMNRLEIRLFPADKKHPPAMAHVDWADMLVLQRVKSRSWRSYVLYAKRKGKPVVYDLDDNVFEIPPDHPDYKNRVHHKVQNTEYEWYVRRADGITVSTRALDLYMRRFGDHIFLLRNYIDPPVFVPAEEDDDQLPPPVLTIGYAGTRTHAADFKPLIQPLQKIGSDHKGKVRLFFLGYLPDELAGNLNLSFDSRYLFYEHYLSELRKNTLHLGLAPLRDDYFNRCKSNIKFLEYSLAGIPGIYSNVEPYRETILDPSTGLLVEDNTEEQWLAVLQRAITAPELLLTIRRNAHRCLQRYFLLKDHYLEWWDTYRSILTSIGRTEL